jgi:hypothetical protein
MHWRLSAGDSRWSRSRRRKKYVFDGPKGKAHLRNIFDGRRQLILYHFMFAPTVVLSISRAPGREKTLAVEAARPGDACYLTRAPIHQVICPDRCPPLLLFLSSGAISEDV